MNKYKFTYYLNTATAERRPTTKEDIEKGIMLLAKVFQNSLK